MPDAGGLFTTAADAMSEATTADDMLTILHGIPVAHRYGALLFRSDAAWARLLRAAADLCGVDSEGMSPKRAAAAILANF